MRIALPVVLVVAAGAVSIGLWVSAEAGAQQETDEPNAVPSAGAEASEPNVPPHLVQRIRDQFERPQASSRSELLRKMLQQMETAVELGRKVEKQYPEAENLHEVRTAMLHAANMSAWIRGTDEARRQVVETARRILESDAPPAAKVTPDALVLQEKLAGMTDEEIGKALRSFVSRYEGHRIAVGTAYVTAARLAEQHGLDELVNTYADKLEERYLSAPGVRDYLRSLGRRPDVGRPFQATLTRLDGSKLNLPGDLQGKVVVVDFWATWCGPCIASLPHLKEVYQEYNDRGVEIVGISLDRPGQREHVKRFVRQRNMDWIHTYSGKYWDDPTAGKYGISGIPAIWVVGADGKVVSSNARGNLEETIEKALKQREKAQAEQPAGQSD